MLVAVVYKCVPCYCDAVQVSRLPKKIQPVIKGLLSVTTIACTLSN